MGKMIDLTASDGSKLQAYQADPSGTPKGGLVIIQEIFGVNKHMKAMTDSYAADGYLAVCPAMFDRAEKGVDMGYDQDTMAKGREYRGKLDDAAILADVGAALDVVKSAGKTGIIGFCFGGYVTWIGAANLGFDVAVGYYGGGIAGKLDAKPKCPIQLHFGDQDQAIPMEDIDKIKAAFPDVPTYVYEGAGHGFACDERASFDEAATKTSRERTNAFLAENM